MDRIVCISNSLKEVIYNLECTNIIEINCMIEDLKDELEDVGKKVSLENEKIGLEIRDVVDELENYTDCCNLRSIREGVNDCIFTLENLV